VSERLVIPARFNGPPESGNGGYSAGAVASFVGDAATVSLRRHVPLETALSVDAGEGAVRIFDGEDLIAEAQPASSFDLKVPPPVSAAAARQATARYRGLRGAQFSRCFVCGLDREDGLGLHSGEVDGRDVVASPWRPASWTAGADGLVRAEIVWAALDCPTYFAAYLRDELVEAYLVRMTASIEGPVAAGEEHVVMAWPLATDGRKRRAGCALLAGDGRVLGRAEALLVEPRRAG
jgi:hypothetical protein